MMSSIIYTRLHSPDLCEYDFNYGLTDDGFLHVNISKDGVVLYRNNDGDKVNIEVNTFRGSIVSRSHSDSYEDLVMILEQTIKKQPYNKRKANFRGKLIIWSKTTLHFSFIHKTQPIIYAIGLALHKC